MVFNYENMQNVYIPQIIRKDNLIVLWTKIL